MREHQRAGAEGEGEADREDGRGLHPRTQGSELKEDP